MKILKELFVMVCMLGATSVYAQSQTDTIIVYGNCGTCEKIIEKAAKQAGASKADWNMETKKLVVSYSSSKTSNDAIQKSVAAAGYDTEKYTADDKVYDKLHACCHYERKSK